jgi:hypothetical protein
MGRTAELGDAPTGAVERQQRRSVLIGQQRRCWTSRFATIVAKRPVSAERGAIRTVRRNFERR